MTVLGAKLKEIIDENDINIYQLSKYANIDRPTIHKMISAKRIPSEEFMEKLLNALPVTPAEKSELQKVYEIQKVGEFTYNQRNQVLDILLQISEMPHSPEPDHTTRTRIHNKHNGQIETANGEVFVNSLIEDMVNLELCNAEEPFVHFSLPYDYTFFFDFLFMRYAKDSRLKIKCLLELSKKSVFEKRNTNLDVLRSILPFILITRQSFDAYYVYSDSPMRHSILSPMPYYILTSSCVITLSSDLKKAILYQNTDVLNCYGAIFNETASLAQPFIRRLNSLQEAIMYYHSFFGSEDIRLNCIEPQPCLMHYFDRDFIEKHVYYDAENREIFVEIATEYCKTLKNSAKSAVLTFSKEGLYEFLETGCLAYLPMNMIEPFNKREIIELLQKLIRDVENDYINHRVLNPSRLKPSPYVLIDVFTGKCLNIASGDQGNYFYNHIANVTEPSVVEAFSDFWLNITNTELVCSKEDTLKTLYEAIAYLEQ